MPTKLNKQQLVLLVLCMVAFRVLRDYGVLDFAPNVAPITAVILFIGSYASPAAALAVSLITMLVSDLFIGFYTAPVMIAVYGSFVLIALISRVLVKQRGAARVLTTTLWSSTLFFLITNAAVWAFSSMYPHTFDGLMTSYIMGVPFYKYTLLGDLGFAGAFFGGYALMTWLAGRLAAYKATKLSAQEAHYRV